MPIHNEPANQPQKKSRPSAVELLHDPTTVAVSVAQASEILGIAKSTAHNAYRETGYLCAGVPVLRVGKRCIVPITYLRAALGISEVVNDGK